MGDDDTAYINEHAKLEASNDIPPQKLEESSKSFTLSLDLQVIYSQNLTEDIRYPFSHNHGSVEKYRK